MSFPSNFDLKGVANNYLSLINDVSSRLQLLERADISAESLAEISEDLGVIRAGRFVAAASGTDLGSDANGNPTLGNLTGTAMLWPGVLIGTEVFTIVGAVNGNFEFGLSALDGTAVFAAGAGTIDSTGITMQGLFYPLQFTAVNAGFQRTAQFGMTLLAGSLIPNLQWYQSAPAGSNVVLNGNAESGSTASWTDSATAWSATTSNPYAGTYSFKHDPTNTGCPAVLTQVITGITAGNLYTVSFASYRAQGYLTPKILITWRTSLHANIYTDTILGNNGVSWLLTTKNLTAPVSATEVVITLDFGDPFQDFRYDNVSFSAAGNIVQVTTTDSNLLFQNSSLSSPVIISNYQGARVWSTIQQSINNATLTDLTFDSETYDTDNIHSTVTNNNRLTCQTPGIYHIWGATTWAQNGTGERVMHIFLNGTTTIASNIVTVVAAAFAPTTEINTIYQLNAGDYVTLQVFQNSGGALTAGIGVLYASAFGMQKVG